jgi:hypothetical protein
MVDLYRSAVAGNALDSLAKSIQSFGIVVDPAAALGRSVLGRRDNAREG